MLAHAAVRPSSDPRRAGSSGTALRAGSPRHNKHNDAVDAGPEGVRKVTVQIRPPKGTFPGEIAEGFYRVVDNAGGMTNRDGKPLNGDKHIYRPARI